jgi:CHAD domain-containing protein
MPGPNGLAADALRAMISTHVRNLMLSDVNVRRELPDSVHQMRVAARRLRSVLTSFAPLFETEWADGLRSDLKWLASELGAIRDTEVLHARLTEHSRELPEPFALRAKETLDVILGRREDGALAGALAALRSDRHQFVIEDLVEAANSPRFTDLAYQSCRGVLPLAVARSWRTLDKTVRSLDFDGPSDTWHRARIKAKRARYTAEAVAPIFGKRAERLARSLADVTDVLGSHQDAFVAQQFLQSNTEGVDGSTGFALGLLFEREYVHEMDDRRAFLELWPSTLRAARASDLIDS